MMTLKRNRRNKAIGTLVKREYKKDPIGLIGVTAGFHSSSARTTSKEHEKAKLVISTGTTWQIQIQ